MCGVVGLLIRDRSLEPSLGSMLVPMIDALADRGPDSSGIAVYSDPGGQVSQVGEADVPTVALGNAEVRLSLGSDETLDWEEVVAELGSHWPGDTALAFESGAVVGTSAGRAGAVVAHLEHCFPGVRVVARGRAVVVVKATGRPEETCRHHGLGAWPGYLAVAHTRMATESDVTLLHSHPFVTADDLCVVHNGSFSNYASVGRWLRTQGVSFDSDNDSEVAARLLAERLGAGDDLEEATRWIMKELDGFFTMVVTTGDAMSVVRDAFACKPAVVAETPAYVAVASEYRALAHLPGITTAHVFEPRPEEVYTWTRSTATH